MSEHDINTPDATHESEDKNKIVDETAVEDHFKEKTAISRHTRAADNHQTEHNARRASKDGTSASPEKQAVSSKIKPLFDGIYDLVDERYYIHFIIFRVCYFNCTNGSILVISRSPKFFKLSRIDDYLITIDQ